MKRLWIALALVLLCVALPAMAQQVVAPNPSAGANTAVAPDRAAPAAVLGPSEVGRPDAPPRHGRQADSGLLQSNLTVSSGMIEPTPEMWLYEQQLREYLDPRMAVRRNAEFQAAQRRNRIAARKWFGFSSQRPNASPDPYNGEYSPSWVGNSGLYPYRWNGGGGPPWVALRPGMAAY